MAQQTPSDPTYHCYIWRNCGLPRYSDRSKLYFCSGSIQLCHGTKNLRALNIIWNFSFPGVYNIKFKILQIPLTYIYNIITLISMNNDYKCNNHNKKSKLYNQRVSLKCRLLLWYHNRHCNRLKRQAAKLIWFIKWHQNTILSKTPKFRPVLK